MPYSMLKGDITEMSCDAIVCPTDPDYSGGGGADYAIHQAAGPEMDDFCCALPHLEMGSAVISPGFHLKARHVIHTFGPIYEDGTCGEGLLLRACYRSCLEIASLWGLNSIAFPLISSGTFGFPKDQVLHIALDEISDFLTEHEMTVYIVLFSNDQYDVSKELKNDIDEYIATGVLKTPIGLTSLQEAGSDSKDSHESLIDMLNNTDGTFQGILSKLIEERGMKDSQCYHKANVSKQVFSRIMSGQSTPKKSTVVALGIALGLDEEGMQAFLKPLGLTLSNTLTFDIIITYCLKSGLHDVMLINELLYKYDQELLGNVAKD